MHAPTINQTAIKVDGRPQVFTSDGSLRRFLNKLRAGTALVGVQNANLIFQTTLAGHQSVYKSEALALVIAAENASHWSEVYCFIDNQSVVQGSSSPPLRRAHATTSAKCLLYHMT